MKVKGPILTLIAVVALGVGILIVNMTLFAREDSPEPPAAEPVQTAEPGETADVTETPAPAEENEAPGFPEEAMYVAEFPSAEGPIVLGISVDGNEAIAYACNGATVEVWLRGEVSADTIELTGRDDAELNGSYWNGAVDGVLGFGGQEWDFMAEEQSAPAALYAFGTEPRMSWIVQQDGSAVGVVRNADGSTSPAPGINPDGTAVLNGQTVQANLITGSDEIP